MNRYTVACSNCSATFVVEYGTKIGLLLYCTDCGSQNIVVARDIEIEGPEVDWNDPDIRGSES
jgi:DNA-directed RNA polymerase subunit RPC12/RpoP